ncbi:MAG: DUF309 domain-containing protein [Candidatus Omnitrophota bacterium]|jgi:hypothetical protein|nr:MAG: DUF309 domain-containing protein [Candidatus Omnitrophota bacterium]
MDRISEEKIIPNQSIQAPRYAPEFPFPSYAFVPGRHPHPINHPEGHSYGLIPEEVEEPDPDNWKASQPYLYGIDLFNHGYYWEAHEIWESLWNACGRVGCTAMFLKALIKLAAAGVKAREGVPQGVRKLSRGAMELLLQLEQGLGQDNTYYMGLDIKDILSHAHQITLHPIEPMDDHASIACVFSNYLILH